MPTKIANLKKALLVMHSPIDKIVGIENAQKIYEYAKHPKSFISLDKADHLLIDSPADSKYVASVLATWASRYLQ
jgi:putative redox protein